MCAALLVLAIVPGLTATSGDRTLLPKVSSVAVLPFRAPAGDELLASTGQDLAEELSNQLARAGMQVAAQGATAALGPSALPQEAAKRLSVDAVFTGAIRPAGEQIKIRIELVNSSNGFQVWSDTFTSPRTEASTNGVKLAEEVLSRLRLALAAKQ